MRPREDKVVRHGGGRQVVKTALHGGSEALPLGFNVGVGSVGVVAAGHHPHEKGDGVHSGPPRAGQLGRGGAGEVG